MSTTQDAQSRKPPRLAPDYIAHWVVKSTRTEQMVRWYGVVFGAEIAYQDDGITFLTWDDESHRLAIIAVPTGIVTAELGRHMKIQMDQRACSKCGLVGHDPIAGYCKRCGNQLDN